MDFLIEATHVPRRIIRPALAADVGIKMCIAVGDDIEPRHLLFVQIDRDRIDILFAKLVVHHRVQKTTRTKICVYQLGRGSEPVMVVGSMVSLVARSMASISPGIAVSLNVVYVRHTPLGNDLRRFVASDHGQSRSAAHLSWAVFTLWQKFCYN